MNWTSPADLRAQVQRLWDRGDLLRAAVSPAIAWPLRLSIKGPGAGDISDRFDAVRAWASPLANIAQLRIEWRDWRHRVQGAQRLPESAWLDSLPAALAFIGKTRQAQEFDALWRRTSTVQPALLPWLSRRPLRALDLIDQWDQLMAIVGWLQVHPRPGVYLRQVDVAGVDSKFIESHRAELIELLDLTLPPEAIEPSATGITRFAHRYGFLDKPARIRFRLLDAALPGLPGCTGLCDVALDATSFAALALPVKHVFITENETNFLAFPPARRAMVIFGAGYGWEPLARAPWLHQCAVHYWGDLDTHGFAILDQLRGWFPGVSSILMDRETLLAHRLHWGEEPTPTNQDLRRLTPQEQEVYNDLRFNRLQPQLRLEQERVGFEWVRQRLRQWL